MDIVRIQLNIDKTRVLIFFGPVRGIAKNTRTKFKNVVILDESSDVERGARKND